MTLSAYRFRYSGLGHHSPDAIVGLTLCCTVDRWQERRRSASFLVKPSNSTQVTASMRAVSSKTMFPVVCVKRRFRVTPPRCCRQNQS